MEKGEIAQYEQFLLFPTVFSKDLLCRHVKPGLLWERVEKKQILLEKEKMILIFNPFNDLGNIVGKGENAEN